MDYFIIQPAELIVQNATLKAILTIGQEFNIIFDNLNFSLLQRTSHMSGISTWPVNHKTGKPIRTTISIWQSPKGVRYLNTYSQYMKCPQTGFDQIISQLI